MHIYLHIYTYACICTYIYMHIYVHLGRYTYMHRLMPSPKNSREPDFQDYSLWKGQRTAELAICVVCFLYKLDKWTLRLKGCFRLEETLSWKCFHVLSFSVYSGDAEDFQRGFLVGTSFPVKIYHPIKVLSCFAFDGHLKLWPIYVHNTRNRLCVNSARIQFPQQKPCDLVYNL